MQELQILKGQKEEYPVFIGSGILENLEEYIEAAPAFGEKLLIVCDNNTKALFAASVKTQLEALAYQVFLVSFPAGESSKNLHSLEKILNAVMDYGLSRKDSFIALGGGVVGDLCGFAASIFLRGVRYIQIPTSFLSQIDSSVGGKTGIDSRYGKNTIGSFYQASLVLVDSACLETLPKREIASAWAEMIKYAFLSGEELVKELEEYPHFMPDESFLAKAIAIKASYVEEDTFDKGKRMHLNFGHSIGHALEAYTNYKTYTHGEAVAIGMREALLLGEKLGINDDTLRHRLEALAKKFALPSRLDISLNHLADYMQKDKKADAKGLSFVFLEAPGKAFTKKIQIEDLLHANSVGESSIKFSEEEVKDSNSRSTSVSISPSELEGEITPPPSKSMTHRYLIATALALYKSKEELSLSQLRKKIRNLSSAWSEDSKATCLGILQVLEASAEEAIEIDCAESGTTLRFLLAIAAVLGRNVRFIGRGKLGQRPIQAYKDLFTANGILWNEANDGNGFLPLSISGRLEGEVFKLPGNVSSQYISGILMALAIREKDAKLIVSSPLESKAYVDLTIQVLEDFGIGIDTNVNLEGQITYRIKANQTYRLAEQEIEIERDYSQAAFWYLAKYLGHDLQILGMDEKSLQADKAIVQCLMNIEEASKNDEHLTIDVSQFPDIFPALALASSWTSEKTKVSLVNASRLKDKESNRLLATKLLLDALGVKNQMLEDALIIQGNGRKAYQAARIDSFKDHRIAMLGAVAATKASLPCQILDSQSVEKSYPHFFEDLRRLGAKVE